MNTENATRAVAVFGKIPRPGRVKTRLTPKLSPELACELYRAFLQDMFDLVDRAAAESPLSIDRYFVCAFSRDERNPQGDPEPHYLQEAKALMPSGWLWLDERGRDLGDRINSACEDMPADTTVVVGSDSPTMAHTRILEAFEKIESCADVNKKPTVIGPTADGGYYLVAMSHVRSSLFENVVWSTEGVLAQTHQNVAKYGIPYAELTMGYDIDHVEDFERALVDAKAGYAHRTAAALDALILS